jgi:enoyl-CoA hydratase/carnithine racemase
MCDEYLRVELDGPVGRIMLDRPERGHAWLAQMWTRAADMLDDLAASPEVRAILLDSSGERIFSGGADIFDLASSAATQEGASDILNRIEGLMAAIERAPQPVIAVVSGTAIGAGLEIAAAADLRVASDTARFGIPAARLGIVVTRTDVARIVRMAGPALASDLLLTGRVLDAAEALAARIVSFVRPADQLRAAARDLALRIAALSPFAVREMKRHVLAVSPRVEWGSAAFSPSIEALTSEDFRERRPRPSKGRTGPTVIDDADTPGAGGYP